MSVEHIKLLVLEAVKQHFSPDLDAPLTELNQDSLEFLEAILQIENLLMIKVPDEAIARMNTPRDVYNECCCLLEAHIPA